jgi:hypothetical protein
MLLDDALAISAGSEPILGITVGGVQVWPVTVPAGTYATGIVRVDTTHGGVPPRIATLAFYSGTTLLAGTAVASSESTTLTGAAKAFDGDAATYWEPGLGGVWELGLNFTAASSFDRIEYTFASVESADNSGSPASLTIIGRTGSTDTMLWTEPDITAMTPGETRTFIP